MAARTNRAVRWLAKAACWIFYRTDHIGGVPAAGAVLLLPNHPNSLLDPALVWAAAERDVRFLAKSTLFDGFFGRVLREAGAIPVYRKMDHGVDTSKNAETFAAVSRAFAAGDAVCIFPEGHSHSTGRLEPLRTGAARMALDAERRGTRVALVPVGLNIDRKVMFRSRVTVVFGQPFSARDLLRSTDTSHERQDSSEMQEAAAVKALTARIAERIRGLLVEADPNSDAVLVDRVDRLYTAARARPLDPAQRLGRRRTIAAGIARLRQADPSRYEEILLRLRRYDHRLQRFGLRDRDLNWKLSRTDVTLFALREIGYGIILLPLCLAGFITFFLPYRLTWLVAHRATNRSDVVATAQVLAGAAIYASWLFLLGAATWWAFGRRTAIVAMALLPVIAIAALFAIERESAVVEAVRSWWMLRRTGWFTRARLRRRRSEVADLLDEVYEWLEAERVSSADTSARRAPTRTD
jgi:1-acyl-sn-glycerol-3-phosphate acyltransferase